VREYGYTQPRQRFRPTLLSTSEPQKKRRISSGTDRSGPLAHIRRAALDVLTLLRELEESMRLALSDDAYDALERPATQSRLRGTYSCFHMYAESLFFFGGPSDEYT